MLTLDKQAKAEGAKAEPPAKTEGGAAAPVVCSPYVHTQSTIATPDFEDIRTDSSHRDPPHRKHPEEDHKA